jgi:hypothetical protein
MEEVKDIDLTKVTPDPDLSKASYEPGYGIGTMYFDSDGACWKYIKIIFSNFPEGESYIYQWVPWNGMARFVELTLG